MSSLFVSLISFVQPITILIFMISLDILQPVNIVDNVLFFGGGSSCGGGTSGGGAGGGGGGQGGGQEGGGRGGGGWANDGQGIRLMGGRAHVHIDDMVRVVQPESGQQSRRLHKDELEKNKF